MNSYVVSRNYGNNLAPGLIKVKLAANVVADIGNMLVFVDGYGVLPGPANATTGKMAGIVIEPANNAGGVDGAVSALCLPMVAAFANDTASPCSQTDVGTTVYASSSTTISNAATAGPPAGRLIAYDPTNIQGRPCIVALNCMV